jgi:hypothetical protein
MEEFQNPKIKTAAKEAGKAIGSKMMAYFTAALGLVAGLAWNDAIKAIIEYLIPNNGTGILAKVFYAIIVTILVAIIFVYLEKRFPSEEK